MSAASKLSLRVWKSVLTKKEWNKMKITQKKTHRLLTCAFAFALTLTIIMTAATQTAFAQEHKVMNLSPTRGLPFNDGIVAGNTLYLAGQEGTDEASKLVLGGIGPKTTAALDNIQKVLKAAGYELKDVVSVTVYLADIHEFPDMNKVYKSVMPDPKPARATLQAAALVNNARVEISAIAVRQKQ
jgi:2-iminobutanoate/2-iminopropanoate deaminase